MSNQKVQKSGKLPISAKKELEVFDMFSDQSLLDINPEVRRVIEERGHTLRWINATKFKLAGGFHKHGWQPVKVSDLPDSLVKGSNLAYGATAEGFLIRNDMMLASRPSELTARHRASLETRTKIASGKVKAVAESMRENIKGYGSVQEGYEENGED